MADRCGTEKSEKQAELNELVSSMMEAECLRLADIYRVWPCI